MKEQIKVCLVQPDMAWEDIDANLELLDGMLAQVESGTDLVVLPETFSTGFTIHAEKYA